MKIEKKEFEQGLQSIKTCITKFNQALEEMDPQENQKIIEAGNYFYTNLQAKLMPIHEKLKAQLIVCIDERDYQTVEVLLACLKEVNELQDAVAGLKQ
ncbi:MAG: hypothetical protein RSD70_05940 [Acidaminococcaceae bacterium]